MSTDGDSARQGEEFERLRPAGAGDAADLGRVARHAEQVEEGAVELRPRGVGEVLDLGLDLVRARFGLCVALGLVVWLPIRVIMHFLPKPEIVPGSDFNVMMQEISGSIWANIAVSLGSVLAAALTARMIGDVLEGRASSVGRAASTAVSRLPGLIVIGLLAYVGTVSGMVLFCWLCASPGLVVAWVLAPAPYVYVLEGVNIRTAIRRSVRISCGRLFSWESFFAFWRWVGIFWVGALLVLSFTMLTGFSEVPKLRDWMLDALRLSPLAYDVLWIVLGSLFMAIATTVQAGYMTAYYLDCRVRREGLDLETWLGRIRPPAQPASGVAP